MKSLQKIFLYFTLLIFFNSSSASVKICSDNFSNKINQSRQQLVVETGHELPFYILNSEDDDARKVLKSNKKYGSISFVFLTAEFYSLIQNQFSTFYRIKKTAVHFASKYHKILKSKETLF